MKKLVICSVALAFAAGAFVSTRNLHGQAAKTPSAHQVGLIDMAYVFKNYDKFKAQTEALQADIKSRDDQAKTRIEAMRTMQERLGSLQAGSPDHQKVEQDLISMQTELETFKKKAQLEFFRREAEIYKTVYSEVQKAVTQYATFHKYTLIMRFNRDGLDRAENPQEIIQSMNRQVVFFRGEDDCTDVILLHLNEQYGKSSGGAAPATSAARPAAAKSAAQPASGVRN